jgi:hypothetical protein
LQKSILETKENGIFFRIILLDGVIFNMVYFKCNMKINIRKGKSVVRQRHKATDLFARVKELLSKIKTAGLPNTKRSIHNTVFICGNIQNFIKVLKR